MDHSTKARRQVVETTLTRVRQTLAQQGLNRQTLDTVLAELKQLAARPELWNASDFPPPEAGERQARYLIDQQDDKTFALYLNVMRPGKRIPPTTTRLGPVSPRLRARKTILSIGVWMTV